MIALGVWKVSVWCLIDPGCCQDCVDGITVGKQITYNYRLSQLGLSGKKFLTFTTPTLIDLGVSGCVWKVSGGCLGDS